ncbi:hypothetical protein AKJ45_02200 [candidate division MSBL1 archaeon SCGC-AAA261F19]|uniref:PD-(D/E)XK endonuclease-like domain-containing protein n=1 Tax=candidate division MSBL1 archaeon SCGC-AAA261F19 TaxID=1698275 RepID=A0A133V9V1_9EURY|nr:hypothetical protein AKJ45_02200 [candidate division MSBL1 archaeon SCGC-AAA261F19]
MCRFEECPKAYEFKYIQRVEVERVRNIYGFMGRRVHETLEKLHEDLRDGKRNSLSKLLRYYNKTWDRRWASDIQAPEDSSPRHFLKIGARCIQNYYVNHEPFDQDRTIGTEVRLCPKVGANDEEYTLRGKIDRLAITPDGQYRIHDYKTGRNLPTQERIDRDRQLGLYQLAVKQNYPDAEDVELIWHYLRFPKDIRTSRSREDLKNLQREVVSLIREIERAEEKGAFPTMRGGANCNWCDYKQLCPEWSHLYETEALPDNEFLNEDGVVLVDELTGVEGQLNSLKEKRSKLMEKKRKLEEAIINYANQRKVNSVYGTEKRATIIAKEKIKFPTKKQKGREELEKLIKDLGKWSEVASLRLSTLKRIAKNNEWPEKLLKKLDRFREIEEVTQVRLENLDN